MAVKIMQKRGGTLHDVAVIGGGTDVGIATCSQNGIARPDCDTITIDGDGVLSVNIEMLKDAVKDLIPPPAEPETPTGPDVPDKPSGNPDEWTWTDPGGIIVNEDISPPILLVPAPGGEQYAVVAAMPDIAFKNHLQSCPSTLTSIINTTNAAVFASIRVQISKDHDFGNVCYDAVRAPRRGDPTIYFNTASISSTNTKQLIHSVLTPFPRDTDLHIRARWEIVGTDGNTYASRWMTWRGIRVNDADDTDYAFLEGLPVSVDTYTWAGDQTRCVIDDGSVTASREFDRERFFPPQEYREGVFVERHNDTYTDVFVVPNGVTEISVLAVGGGGRGENGVAGKSASTAGVSGGIGGRGGLGGAIIGARLAVTPGQVIPITVGGGGTGQATSFGDMLVAGGGSVESRGSVMKTSGTVLSSYGATWPGEQNKEVRLLAEMMRGKWYMPRSVNDTNIHADGYVLGEDGNNSAPDGKSVPHGVGGHGNGRNGIWGAGGRGGDGGARGGDGGGYDVPSNNGTSGTPYPGGDGGNGGMLCGSGGDGKSGNSRMTNGGNGGNGGKAGIGGNGGAGAQGGKGYGNNTTNGRGGNGGNGGDGGNGVVAIWWKTPKAA